MSIGGQGINNSAMAKFKKCLKLFALFSLLLYCHCQDDIRERFPVKLLSEIFRNDDLPTVDHEYRKAPKYFLKRNKVGKQFYFCSTGCSETNFIF